MDKYSRAEQLGYNKGMEDIDHHAFANKKFSESDNKAEFVKRYLKGVARRRKEAGMPYEEPAVQLYRDNAANRALGRANQPIVKKEEKEKKSERVTKSEYFKSSKEPAKPEPKPKPFVSKTVTATEQEEKAPRRVPGRAERLLFHSGMAHGKEVLPFLEYDELRPLIMSSKKGKEAIVDIKRMERKLKESKEKGKAVSDKINENQKKYRLAIQKKDSDNALLLKKEYDELKEDLYNIIEEEKNYTEPLRLLKMERDRDKTDRAERLLLHSGMNRGKEVLPFLEFNELKPIAVSSKKGTEAVNRLALLYKTRRDFRDTRDELVRKWAVRREISHDQYRQEADRLLENQRGLDEKIRLLEMERDRDKTDRAQRLLFHSGQAFGRDVLPFVNEEEYKAIGSTSKQAQAGIEKARMLYEPFERGSITLTPMIKTIRMPRNDDEEESFQATLEHYFPQTLAGRHAAQNFYRELVDNTEDGYVKVVVQDSDHHMFIVGVYDDDDFDPLDPKFATRPIMLLTSYPGEDFLKRYAVSEYYDEDYIFPEEKEVRFWDIYRQFRDTEDFEDGYDHLISPQVFAAAIEGDIPRRMFQSDWNPEDEANLDRLQDEEHTAERLENHMRVVNAQLEKQPEEVSIGSDVSTASISDDASDASTDTDQSEIGDGMPTGGRKSYHKPRLEEGEFVMPFSESSGYEQWGFGKSGGDRFHRFGRMNGHYYF
jgi:hypothetical protein